MNFRTTKGIFSLARPLNALITFAAIIAAGVIAGAGWSLLPSLLTTATAGLLLTAAGNALNDVFDVSIDKVNKPDRAIVSGAVTLRQAVIAVVLLSVTGLAFSAIAGSLTFSIAAVSSLAIFAYNAGLKRVPLAGNLVVGLLTGAAFFFGASVTGNIDTAVFPAILSCFFNWAREILKDVEDVEGDRAAGIRTFPIIAGVPASLLLSTMILLFIIAGSAAPYFFNIYSSLYFWIVLAGVDTVLIYTIFSMWKDSTKTNIARLAILLKFEMIIGIAAIVLGTR